jgi:NitT/TauT family transport system substrate-binding protein
MKGQVLSLGFAFSAMVALGGIGGPASAAEPLKIYGFPWIGWAPLYVAEEKGFFKGEDIEVDVVSMEWKNPQEGFDLLAGKQMDGRSASLDESALYWRPEAPFSVILVTEISSGGDGVLVRSDRNIGSVEDLRAKKIGLRLNTPSHFLLNYLLQQKGMSEEDVSLVDLSAEHAASAVVAGDVDAAVTWSPYLAKAAEDLNVEVLITSKDTPGLIAGVLVMRKDVLDSNPQACQGLVRAWNKAVEYQNANPDEAAAIMAKGLGYGTPDDIKADLAGIVLQGKEGNAQLFAGDGEGTALETTRFAIDLWTELGRLSTPVKAEDLIDASCLEK